MQNKTPLPAKLMAHNVVLERNGKSFAALPDIDIHSGESVAIVGPSGSGKTTALMALSGIRAPFGGEIAIEGIALWQLAARERDRLRGRRIGLIFQSFHLIDALTVAGNLKMAASCAGLRPDSKRIEELLGGLDILGLRDKRADRISHGQAQRVAVARALVNKPAVIVADEPTSALDDANASRLLDLLKATARAEGAGLIVTTHDRRVCDAVDRIVGMEPCI